MRKEHDTIGEVEVPSDKLWGAQTQRSFENFKISTEKNPPELIYALAVIKQASARVNFELGLLDEERSNLIVDAAKKITSNEHAENFPLSIWQTGSGTQSNMNMNEVLASLCNLAKGLSLDDEKFVHPNDHVNRSQSSNDTYPSAIRIASVIDINESLLPNLRYFLNALEEKVEEFKGIIKVGRTHLMDAVPLLLSSEVSSWAQQIKNGIEAVEQALPHLCELPQGGTAVGTGLNSHPLFAQKVATVISEITSQPFVTAPNKYEAIATIDAEVRMSGALNLLAVSLMKIANDIRLLGSGPRCGLSELMLPANEPGSSIMPGKVNPTQCEALAMLCVQVMGNHTTLSIAGSQGHLQLNTYLPLAAYNLLQSIRLIGDGVRNFTDKCLRDLKPHEKNIKKHLDHTLMLVTALNTKIGYEKSAKIAKLAHEKGLTLKQATLELGFLSEEAFDEAIDPSKMV